MMHVLLASPRGFCAGVNMAIECLNEAIRRFGTDIYVYHEIVHNKYVVDQFRRQGVTFVSSVDDVPHGGFLLYSAHGVAPDIREAACRRALQTIDATCPLVMKVHSEAIRYAHNGYHVILIGHKGHDEVIGTMGEIPGQITLVETPQQVDELPFPPQAKVAYLTQTTLSVFEANHVIDRLKQRYPSIVSPRKQDICYATTNRQHAVATLTRQADLVIVLGSRNSSNSQRLTEIARSTGRPAHLVDGAQDLSLHWFAPDHTVLITAGASAPEIVVQQCVDFLVQHFEATVEVVAVSEEHVRFPLPSELRPGGTL